MLWSEISETLMVIFISISRPACRDQIFISRIPKSEGMADTGKRCLLYKENIISYSIVDLKPNRPDPCHRQN